MDRFWVLGDSDFALAFREPNLLVPGKKPIGQVEVIAYWKSRGLTLFQTADLSVINNQSSFIADTAGKVTTRDGLAWNFDDTNKYVTFDAPQNSSGTVWVLLRNDRNYTSAGSGIGALASTRNSSNNGWTFELYSAIGSGSYGGQNYVNKLAFTIQGVGSYAIGVSNNGLLEYLYPYPTSVSGSFTNGSSIDFYINGRNVGNRSIGSVTTTSVPLIIGSQGQVGSGFLPLGEPVLAVAYFDAHLSDDELQRFDAFARDFSNRLLKPANQTPYLIGVGAGGGASYAETYAASASAQLALTNAWSLNHSETYAASAASSLQLSESYATGYAETYAASAAAALALTDAWLLDFAETYGANASGDLALTDDWSLDYSEAYAVGAAADLALADAWQLDYAETLTVTATGDLALSNAYAVGNNYNETFSVAGVAELSLTDVWAPHYGETLAADATAALALTDTWQLDYAETLAASAAAELLLSDAYDSPAPGAYDETFSASAIAALDLTHLFSTPNALPAGINHLTARRFGGFFAVKP